MKKLPVRLPEPLLVHLVKSAVFGRDPNWGVLLQQLDAFPLIKKTQIKWGFLDDGSWSTLRPCICQCLFKTKKRLVLISKATDIVSVNMSNDLLVVKDAQPVAFERSAASGYLKTVLISVSIWQ